MSGSTYNEETLPDLLPVYYRRLFPQAMFHKWLCYGRYYTSILSSLNACLGDPKNFNKREISFTLHGDIYLRYQSFDTLEEFAQALHKRFPIKIDIGAVYKDTLKGNYSAAKTPIEREVVFDIDMTDYDEIRTCCSGADVCGMCWKFMIIACKILDAALRDDFSFEHVLWVFSGRRGIHCWVADKKARKMGDAERSCVAEYLNVIRGGMISRKVKLGFYIHSSLERSLKIIDEYFDAILSEQDILGNNERLSEFLNNLEEDVRPLFREAMSSVNSTAERWNVFQSTFHKLHKEQKIPKYYKNLIEEMKIYYSYPRLDINVTKGMNHLLKAPFCVHPKTGKISVPFKVKSADSFSPKEVPTVSQLLDEVNAYDAKNKGQKITETSEVQSSNFKIKDYKKTSLFKYVAIFNEFLRGLQVAAVRDRSLQNGTAMEC